ncbi:hypothetical protein J3E69DRAFT_349470 [Trichoderma sp. SZMC 28015]
MLFLGVSGGAAGCLALPQYSMCRLAGLMCCLSTGTEMQGPCVCVGKDGRESEFPRNKTTSEKWSCLYLPFCLFDPGILAMVLYCNLLLPLVASLYEY